MSDQNQMKVRLAIFRSIKYGWNTTFESHGNDSHSPDDYFRISDWLDVEFSPMSDDSIIVEQLNSLDQEERRIRNEFQDALNRLNDQRASLKALTHVS